MNVLGISASCRAWGNTDVLVHLALRGAAEEGAETRFLRLPDLELGPCRGCMACVFKDRDCVQQDRLGEFLDAMRWAGAVVLGSPTYVLGATGQIKNLQDRMIRFGMRREFRGKPGLAVAAAGVPGWDPLVLSQVSLLFLFLGMPLVDRFVGYAQGPGEIFDDARACERALEGGRALGRGDAAYRGEPGTCPVCHLDLVTVRPDGSGYCTLCDLPGAWVEREGSRVFRPAEGAEPRWSEAVMRHHFEERILPSGPRFRRRLKGLRARLERFREGGSPWREG